MIRAAFLTLLVCSCFSPTLGLQAVSKNVKKSHGDEVTAMKKVIRMLESVQARTEADGKQRAAIYDKYACFCRSQASELQASVERETAAFERLEEKLTNLEAMIGESGDPGTGVTGTIGTLEVDIANLETELETEETGLRSHTNDAQQEQAKFDASIAAIEAATKAVRSGSTFDKAALFQQVSTVSNKVGLHSSELALLAQTEKPKAYTMQSREVIATLERVRDQFVDAKKEHQTGATRTAGLKRSQINTHRTNIGMKNRDLTDAKNKLERLDNQRSETLASKNEERRKKDANQASLQDVHAQCGAEATAYDAATKAMTHDLTQIAKAIEILKGGGDNAGGASFLELSSAKSVNAKVAAQLRRSASKMHSTLLSALATKISLQAGGADPFVKIRGLINDMIAKLEGEASDEASEKEYCDRVMGEQLQARDAADIDLETANSKKAEWRGKSQEHADTMREKAALITTKQKELSQGNDLQATKVAELNQEIADGEVDCEALTNAIAVLSELTGDEAFIQKKETPYVRENAGADGNTFQDNMRNAGVQDGAGYDGNRHTGGIGSIVALLQDMKTKCEENLQTARDQLQIYESNTFIEEIQSQIDGAIGDKDTASGNKDAADESVTEAEGEISNAKDAVQEAKDQLDVASQRCTGGQGTYEERREAREQEIAALKEALEILRRL